MVNSKCPSRQQHYTSNITQLGGSKTMSLSINFGRIAFYNTSDEIDLMVSVIERLSRVRRQNNPSIKA